MEYDKKRLLTIAKKVEENQSLLPSDISYFRSFEKKNEDSVFIKVAKSFALPFSLFLGFLFFVFPSDFSALTNNLPSWTNLSPQLLAGVDYLWNIIGEPVGRANIIYHIPNIVLYSFGILGVKKILDAIDKRAWLNRVLLAQKKIESNLSTGTQSFRLKNGHSIVFIGKGDFIGMQFVLNHTPNEAVSISQVKPTYTDVWNFYDTDTLFEDLKHVISRCDLEHAGEYLFLPVKDDQIFLPNEKAYDLSPHKLDILCQNIRVIEKEQKTKPKRIIIIGDKFHKSYVQSEDQNKLIPRSEDTITLATIAAKYKNVTLLDPTDIVLRKIIDIAKGRKIVFRATIEGIREYKKRFFYRLKLLGYKLSAKQKGILTIGYDLFEDQTEQQTLARKIDDYFPVVLSKNVHDALIRNGYKKNEFLYVPDLVIDTLSKTADKQ